MDGSRIPDTWQPLSRVLPFAIDRNRIEDTWQNRHRMHPTHSRDQVERNQAERVRVVNAGPEYGTRGDQELKYEAEHYQRQYEDVLQSAFAFGQAFPFAVVIRQPVRANTTAPVVAWQNFLDDVNARLMTTNSSTDTEYSQNPQWQSVGPHQARAETVYRVTITGFQEDPSHHAWDSVSRLLRNGRSLA